jgi:hypothetical protein
LHLPATYQLSDIAYFDLIFTHKQEIREQLILKR